MSLIKLTPNPYHNNGYVILDEDSKISFFGDNEIIQLQNVTFDYDEAEHERRNGITITGERCSEFNSLVAACKWHHYIGESLTNTLDGLADTGWVNGCVSYLPYGNNAEIYVSDPTTKIGGTVRMEKSMYNNIVLTAERAIIIPRKQQVIFRNPVVANGSPYIAKDELDA